MEELLPTLGKDFDNYKILFLCGKNRMEIITNAAKRNPAPSMRTVCENCWITAPQMKPTIPNSVMMNRDNFSARSWPSKSYGIQEKMF